MSTARRHLRAWAPAVRTLARRHPREWWAAAHALVMLVGVRLALRRMPLSTLVGALTPRRPGPTADPRAAELAARYLDTWIRRLPGPPRGSCLSRSLALYRFARAAGLPVRLHCGARREGDDVVGHAWLTLDEQPYLEAARGVTFTVMVSYP